MVPPPPGCTPFLAGDWLITPVTGTIARAGIERRLRPQVMDLMVVLASRPGDVFLKSELLDAVWGSRFVSESALTTAIAELREALEDDSRNPRFIQTVPKRGYRLIAALATAGDDVTQPTTSGAQPSTDENAETVAGASSAVAEQQFELNGLPDTGAVLAAMSREASGFWRRPRMVRKPLIVIAVAAAVVAAIVAMGLRATATPSRAPLIEVPVSLEPGERWPARDIHMTAIAPDGVTLVYAVESTEGRHLVSRNLRTRDVHAIPGTEGAASPFFSLDGSRLGFWKDGAWHAMTPGDHNVMTLADALTSFGAAWRSNGDFVFASTYRSGLFVVPADSHTARPLTVPIATNHEVSHRWPDVLPNSRFVLFSVMRDVGDSQIAALDVVSGARHVVVEDSTRARFAAPDRLLFARGRRLMVARFDPLTARVTGEPVELTNDLAFSPVSGLAQFSVSQTGVLAYLTKAARIDRDLVLVDRTGRTTPVGAPPRPYVHPRASPSGRQIAFWEDVDDTADVWTYDIASRQFTQHTHDGSSWRPVWSPDGRQLGFDAAHSGSANGFVLPVQPGARAEPLVPRDRVQGVEDWLPDGRRIVMSQLEPETGNDLLLVDLASREVRPIANTRAAESGAAVSPNGRWVAYVRGNGTSGDESIEVTSIDMMPPVRVQIASQGREPRWSRDGRELFFRSRGAMYGVRITEAEHALTAGAPVELFRGDFEERPATRANYDVLPDGRFLMLRRHGPPVVQHIVLSLRWN